MISITGLRAICATFFLETKKDIIFTTFWILSRHAMNDVFNLEKSIV